MMMECAFATVAQLGHLKPLMPYMGEMLSRGHSVTLFCASDPKYRREMIKEGLEGVQIIPVEMPDGMREVRQMGILSVLRRGGPLAYASAPLFAAITSHYSSNVGRAPPDVVVSDFFSTAAADAGDKLGAPVVVVFPNPLSMTSLPPPEDRKSPRERVLAALATVAEGLGSRIFTVLRNLERRERGLPPLLEQDIFPALSQQRHMVATTGLGFEYTGRRSPLLHFVGPSPPANPAPLEPLLEDWLDGQAERGTPVVYVAFGTQHTFTKEAVVKLCGQLRLVSGRRGVSVLWSLTAEQQRLLPAADDEQNEETARSSWRVESFVAQWSVLAHPAVRVFVTHNGANSTYEALLNEVPMVCCPTGKDQPANAARVKAAGLGLVVQGGASGLVAEALAAVLDDLPRFSAAAKRTKCALASQGGAARAGDIISDVAAGARGVGDALPRRIALTNLLLACLLGATATAVLW